MGQYADGYIQVPSEKAAKWASETIVGINKDRTKKWTEKLEWHREQQRNWRKWWIFRRLLQDFDLLTDQQLKSILLEQEGYRGKLGRIDLYYLDQEDLAKNTLRAAKEADTVWLSLKAHDSLNRKW